MKHIHNDRDVVCIRADASIRKAAEAMEERSTGCLVVVGGDQEVVGIVTDRDLCLRAVRWDRDPDETDVASVMSKDVRTLPADAHRDEQLELMRRMGVRRIPLVDGDGKPVGLMTADDWIRWISERLDEIATTADPALRHGPLRPAGDLLDDLQEHLDRHLDGSQGNALCTPMVVDRNALLEAIGRLRSAMAGQT